MARLLFGAIIFFLDFQSPAFADKIGGSSLPTSAPQLKGRLTEDGGASSAVLVSLSGGATSNAGPTLLAQPSGYLERAVGFASATPTDAGRLDISIGVSDDHYFAFSDADSWSGQAAAALSKDWGGQETILSLSASRGTDIEERLTDIGVVLQHAWTGRRVAPYVRAETALLDYHDLPDPIPVTHNQDDRDRISTRVTCGLKWTITDTVQLETGAGVDSKHFLSGHDDFGIVRDSTSLFPVIGISYGGKAGSLTARYMPFWRRYKDALFDDVHKHGYAVDGRLALTDKIKAFGGARYGFEETDFLIASAAYEAVAIAGLEIALGWGTFTVAAARTERTYEGLGLIGLSREDEKLEASLYGEVPIVDGVSLTGRVGYMDFESTFGSAGTDEVSAGIGVLYVATQ